MCWQLAMIKNFLVVENFAEKCSRNLVVVRRNKKIVKNCIAVIVILLLLLNGLTNELAVKSFCIAPDKNLFKFLIFLNLFKFF
jgi:hypothetical protein